MAQTNAPSGTKENPWKLKTPPGTSEYTAYLDGSLNPAALVVVVGKQSSVMI